MFSLVLLSDLPSSRSPPLRQADIERRLSNLARARRRGVLDHENLARVRLRMKALERQAARMAPRKYGNRR